MIQQQEPFFGGKGGAGVTIQQELFFSGKKEEPELFWLSLLQNGSDSLEEPSQTGTSSITLFCLIGHYPYTRVLLPGSTSGGSKASLNGVLYPSFQNSHVLKTMHIRFIFISLFHLVKLSSSLFIYATTRQFIKCP